MNDEAYSRWLENSCLRKCAYVAEADAVLTADIRSKKSGLNITAYRCKVSKRLPPHWHIGRKHKNLETRAQEVGVVHERHHGSILTQLTDDQKNELEKLLKTSR